MITTMPRWLQAPGLCTAEASPHLQGKRGQVVTLQCDPKDRGHYLWADIPGLTSHRTCYLGNCPGTSNGRRRDLRYLRVLGKE